jgi:hypothetical protein
MNADERDLLHRHLNGDLNASEQALFFARLQASPELRQALASQAMDEALLSEIILEGRPVARASGRRRIWIPVSIAAAMLAGLTVLLMPGRPAPTALRVAFVQGAATVERRLGTYPLQLGDTVGEGDRILTRRGKVVFEREGLRLEQGEQTSALLHPKGITVKQGVLRALVEPAGQLRLDSIRGEVVARAGIVRMEISPLGMRVEAEEGSVEIQPHGPLLRLEAGRYAQIGAGVEMGRLVGRARVDAAVARARKFLESRQGDVVSTISSEKRHGPAPRRTYAELALLALHRAGAPASDPMMAELLGLVKGRSIESTYAAAIQAMALAEIDPAAHHERIRQCAQYLADSQCANGQWDYGTMMALPEVPSTGRLKRRKEGPPSGDNSVTSYAVLGLQACARVGVEVDADIPARARAWWLQCQNADGGWGYNDSGDRATADAGKTTLTSNASYGSATASAVAALAAIRELLEDDGRSDAAIRRGADWLGANFASDRNPRKAPGFTQLHWLLAAGRAGAVLGSERFGVHEWYAEGADFLLQAQRPSGEWAVEQGEFMAREKIDVLDTCLAILFLKR